MQYISYLQLDVYKYNTNIHIIYVGILLYKYPISIYNPRVYRFYSTNASDGALYIITLITIIIKIILLLFRISVYFVIGIPTTIMPHNIAYMLLTHEQQPLIVIFRPPRGDDIDK